MVKNETIPFKLFACCMPVKGAERSAVCDIQRGNLDLIPNSLFEILTEHDGSSIKQIKNIYNNQYDDIIDEYFEFLGQKEYIFFTDNPHYFPPIDQTWKDPSIISNIIIDVEVVSSLHDYKIVIDDLSDLGCKHIQIRSFSNQPLNIFEEYMQFLEGKRIETVELILKFQSEFTKEVLLELCEKYPRICSLYIHSAPITETLHISPQGMGHIIFYTGNNYICKSLWYYFARLFYD